LTGRYELPCACNTNRSLYQLKTISALIVSEQVISIFGCIHIRCIQDQHLWLYTHNLYSVSKLGLLTFYIVVILRSTGNRRDQQQQHKTGFFVAYVYERLRLVHRNPCVCLIPARVPGTRAGMTYSAADLLRKRTRSAAVQVEIIRYGRQGY